MKSGETGYRRSRAPQNVHPVMQRGPAATASVRRATEGESARSQRRRLESEERRRQRKARKRARQATR